MHLDIPDSEIIYFPDFFTIEEAKYYYTIFLKNIEWKQENITVFGKTYEQPRLTTLYGNNSKSYTYSGLKMNPTFFSKELLTIKEKIEKNIVHNFTTCLANLYRDGKDSNGWHSDDEKELGRNPVIASVSFGAERYFHLRHKHDKSQKTKLLLQNGSLLLMKGETQHFWQHQIPKTAKLVGPRINLTFRTIN